MKRIADLARKQTLDVDIRHHPALFLRDACSVVGWIVAVILLDRWFSSPFITLAAAMTGALGMSINLIQAIIRYRCEELGADTERFLWSRGFFRRSFGYMDFAAVESVSAEQSLLGQLLNYGTITLHGVGGDEVERTFVRNPIEIAQMFRHVQQHGLDLQTL